MLVLGCLLIPAWQGLLAYLGCHNYVYRIRAATGVHEEARFVYFYHYLGLFPVASDREDLEYSRAGAERAFAEHGDGLVTELGYTVREGDLGKLFLYLPDVWLKGAPRDPDMRVANGAAFILALVALFAAFWWIRQPVLGLLVVGVLGSNPFQLAEVYTANNVFGWPITAAIAMLALHLPLLGRRRPPRWLLWAAPVASGLALATIRQIRSEPVAIILSVALAYLAVAGVRWRVRLALVALLAVSFGAGLAGWSGWFDHKIAEAGRRVAAAGGHVYRGPRVQHHVFWHAVWCGLGDFGGKHGYVWGDWVAAQYAHETVAARYGLDVPRCVVGELYDGGHWDAAGKFRKTHAEIPHYGEVLRDKVLHDVTHDPLWYLGVLARRAWRLLTETTPARLSIGWAALPIPTHGLLLLPVLGLLVWSRAWLLLKLVAFSLSLGATAFLIYSGRGTCYYSCTHLFVTAVLCAWLAELACAAVRSRAIQAASA